MAGVSPTRALLGLLAILFCLGAAPAPAKTPFSNWAAVVVAGDWRSTGGGETPAFDNARRDVSASLIKAGFSSANLRQYALRPARDGDDPAVVVGPRAAIEGFQAAAARATEGCLFYITSHGTPEGAVFGEGTMLRPMILRQVLDQTCGQRPTIAIVSACFSGVFIDVLAGPNRMVMTAARPDRSSFGCSDKDTYPYFDACVLQSLPTAKDFLVLSRMVRTCVETRETAENLTPASEPQTFVGSQAALLLPFMQFRKRPPGT